MKRFLCVLFAVVFLCMHACAEEQQLTAVGYVLVATASEGRWFPLPDEESGEYSFTVHQVMGGEDMNNTITITPEGVYVSEADCENNDCVEEGYVTLENKNERVLGNMIVCLPHSITIELFTRAEVEEMMAAAAASAEEK